MLPQEINVVEEAILHHFHCCYPQDAGHYCNVKPKNLFYKSLLCSSYCEKSNLRNRIWAIAQVTHLCSRWAVSGNETAPGKRLLFRENVKKKTILHAFLLIPSIGPIETLSVVIFLGSYTFSQFAEKRSNGTLPYFFFAASENCHHFVLHSVGTPRTLRVHQRELRNEIIKRTAKMPPRV